MFKKISEAKMWFTSETTKPFCEQWRIQGRGQGARPPSPHFQTKLTVARPAPF